MKRLSSEETRVLDRLLHSTPKLFLDKQSMSANSKLANQISLTFSDGDAQTPIRTDITMMMDETTPNYSFDTLCDIDRYLEELRFYGTLP